MLRQHYALTLQNRIIRLELRYRYFTLTGKRFEEIDRKNRLLNIVSSQNGTADIKIYQDINIYVSELETNKTLDFKIEKNRQVYFVQIEGSSSVNEITLNDGDAMEILDIEEIKIKALENSHFLFIEMAKV